MGGGGRGGTSERRGEKQGGAGRLTNPQALLPGKPQDVLRLLRLLCCRCNTAFNKLYIHTQFVEEWKHCLGSVASCGDDLYIVFWPEGGGKVAHRSIVRGGVGAVAAPSKLFHTHRAPRKRFYNSSFFFSEANFWSNSSLVTMSSLLAS